MSKIIQTKKPLELFGGSRTKPLSEGSIKTYISKLKKLNDDKPILDLKFLKDTKSILKKTDAVQNPNTRRSYLIALVAVLKDEKFIGFKIFVYFEDLES